MIHLIMFLLRNSQAVVKYTFDIPQKVQTLNLQILQNCNSNLSIQAPLNQIKFGILTGILLRHPNTIHSYF